MLISNCLDWGLVNKLFIYNLKQLLNDFMPTKN